MFCDGFCGTLINIFLTILVVLALHYVYLLWNSDYWKKRGVFCPDSASLFGNLPGQVTGKRNIIYDLDDLYQKYKKEYSYIGIFQFRKPRLLIFDHNLMKDITIKYFKYFQGTEFYGTTDKKVDPLFGNHSFVLIGEEWKARRTEFSPGFSSARIKAIYPISENVINKMVKYVKDETARVGSGGIDAKDLSARFTISVVSNSVYNIEDTKVFEGQESEIMKTSRSILMPTKQFMIYGLLTTIYPFISKYYKIALAKPEALHFFVKLMENAMRHREESKIQRADYLDYLMTLKKKKDLSDLDVAAHGASFLIDGFDTSSSSISAALKELASNKDIQQKLREEIKKAMPNEEDFNYDNIMNLEYLDQVWNESLRLQFPGAYISRQCTEEVEVELPKDKKLRFEKGSILFYPVRSVHMDPEFFPNPEKFDPDRFSPENGGVKAYTEQGVFVPFGTGPRACPGSRFAISQSKIAIAALVKNFDISINPKSPKEYIIHPQAILATLEGCFLDFKEIKQS